MKKIITIVAALLLTTAVASAQGFSRNDWKIYSGYSIVGGEFSMPDDMDEYTNIVNPISFGVDYGFAKLGPIVLSAGFQMSINTAAFDLGELEDLFGDDFDTSSAMSIIPSIRVAANWSPIDMLNLRGGLALGYSIHSLSSGEDVSDTNEFAWSPYIGADVFIFHGLGVYAELGYGNTSKPWSDSLDDQKETGMIVTLGITFNF